MILLLCHAHTLQASAAPPRTEEEEEALRKAAAAAADDDEDKDKRQSRMPPILASLLQLIAPAERQKVVETNVDAASVRGLLTLIGVLRGQFERHNHVTRLTHTDGVPRGWRRLRGLDSFAEDAEPVGASTWLRHRSCGEMPDAVRRAKPQRGGALAICRDVSTSMHGINAKYASSLALRVIELCQRRRMRVAMLEYSDSVIHLNGPNHGGEDGGGKATRKQGGPFFTTDYPALRSFARRLECGGLTDYEAPLKLSLDEFANDRRLRSPYAPKHILFISDGHPTKGDRRCIEARKRMRRQGVQLHTLFVEPSPDAEYPPLLAALAHDSMGVRMRATVVDAEAGILDVHVVSNAADARGRHAGANRFAGGGGQRGRKLAEVPESGLEAYPTLRKFFG